MAHMAGLPRNVRTDAGRNRDADKDVNVTPLSRARLSELLYAAGQEAQRCSDEDSTSLIYRALVAGGYVVPVTEAPTTAKFGEEVGI